MNKVFEKIIEKQEELFQDLNVIEVLSHVDFDSTIQNSLENFLKAITNEAIEIVKQEVEQYNNGWIPCSSGVLPKRPNSYCVTKMCETEKLLSNKNSRQKRNKPNTKYIKVLAKNYNEAIQLLKDKGLLYET